MFSFVIIAFVIGCLCIIITNTIIVRLYRKKNKDLPENLIHSNLHKTTSKVIKVGFIIMFLSIGLKFLMTNDDKGSQETKQDLGINYNVDNEENYLLDYKKADNTCSMSENFIKLDLYNPATADFSIFDCTSERNSDGSYTILRKVSAKNSFGVEKEFIYKLSIGLKEGNEYERSNWELISIRSEEYR